MGGSNNMQQVTQFQKNTIVIIFHKLVDPYNISVYIVNHSGWVIITTRNIVNNLKSVLE